MPQTKRKAPPPPATKTPVIIEDSVGKVFVSMEAKSGYRNLLNRKIILERGINNSPPFDTYIKKYGWETFCHSPVHANMTMASEFYANFRFRDEKGVVLCRGKWVGISPEIINDYYKLRSSQTLYKDFKKLLSDVKCEDGELVGDWNKVVREVTQEEISMEEILPTNSWSHIDKKYLRPDLNVWYSFVAARLSPVTINSEVQWERIRMLYALKENIAINVGLLIWEAMIGMANSTSGFGFHSLITGLCHRAGCEDRIDDSFKSPMSMLTFKAFQRRVKQNQQASKLPKQPTSAVTLDSLSTMINAHGERLERMEDYLRRFCEYTAAVLGHVRPEGVAVVGPFPLLSKEPIREKMTASGDSVNVPVGNEEHEDEVMNENP